MCVLLSSAKCRLIWSGRFLKFYVNFSWLFQINWIFSILFSAHQFELCGELWAQTYTFIAGNEKSTCLDHRSIWHTGCSVRSFNVKQYLQMENITHAMGTHSQLTFNKKKYLNIAWEENKWNFHIGQTNSLCVPTFMYTLYVTVNVNLLKLIK